MPTPSATRPLGVEVDRGELRHRRQMRALTICDLAAAAGISFGFLSQIERGHRIPSPKTFAAICDALGVDADQRHELVARKVAA